MKDRYTIRVQSAYCALCTDCVRQGILLLLLTQNLSNFFHLFPHT